MPGHIALRNAYPHTNDTHDIMIGNWASQCLFHIYIESVFMMIAEATGLKAYNIISQPPSNLLAAWSFSGASVKVPPHTLSFS